MLTRRLWISLLAGLLAVNALRAQGVNLTEAPLDQRCVRNELTMALTGTIKVKQDGKDVSYAHKAQARHVFMERVLDAGAGIAAKAARFYTTADSTLTFDNNESSKRSLREKRRFLVTQRGKDRIVTFSPEGALTREEMELTEHFDTLAIAGLLPDKMIDVGKTWPIRKDAVAALCDLDGLTEQNLEGKLEAVKGDIAHIKIVGNAKGINLGAQVAMIVNAQLEFDVKAQRIVALEWKEADEREQGPITPALKADVTIKLTRTPIETPEQLSNFALVKVPAAVTPELTSIRHQDAKGRYTLQYARDWHVVSPEDSPQLVLRHLQRGDFIAQATVTVWKKADPKNVMALKDFAALMEQTPGWEQEKEIERTELKDLRKGHQIAYRVQASGKLDGVATVQYFYLIVGEHGDQMMVTFSVVPTHVGRLETRDLELVRELIFPEK